MQTTPSALQTRFEEHLRTKAIPDHLVWSYKKWLRYYLDYCEKYHFSPQDRSSLPRFVRKLNEKKQTVQQQRQAAESINLYYEILGQEGMPPKAPQPQPIPHQKATPLEAGKPELIRESPVSSAQPQRVAPSSSREAVSSSGAYSLLKTVKVSGMPPVAPTGTNNATSSQVQVKQGSGASWKSEYSRLMDEISVRHYSKKTLQTMKF